MADNKKQLIAHMEHQSYGDHGGYTIAIFKADGDAAGVFKPIAYAGVYINPKTPIDISFQNINGDVLSFPFQNKKLAQAVLNAICERRECKFYYGDTEASE